MPIHQMGTFFYYDMKLSWKNVMTKDISTTKTSINNNSSDIYSYKTMHQL